jgi:anti-sigma regulatory factor (Ser/Thr protein kinase)
MLRVPLVAIVDPDAEPPESTGRNRRVRHGRQAVPGARASAPIHGGSRRIGDEFSFTTRDTDTKEVTLRVTVSRCCRAAISMPTDATERIGDARGEARIILRQWGLDLDHPAVDSAIVILSELLTNVYRHARRHSEAADVMLILCHNVLTVAVHDRHPRIPRVPPPYRPNDTSGRGLRLVYDLAADLSGFAAIRVDPDGRGKTIRAELPLAPATTTRWAQHG